jgi:glycosyltransferase involved in cell wall biosynthesis
MNTQPLVSAIIATYDRGYVVCEAIDSILCQTYKNIEVLVVDDGSTDDTQEKLRAYGNRIRVIYQANAGPAAAWNTGIAAAHGEIICFLGSDDIWLPIFVESQVSVLDKAGPEVPCALANALTYWADGRESTSFDLAALRPAHEAGIWVNPLDVLLTRFVMCGQMLAVRRAVLDRIGYFDRDLRYMEDFDMALRLSLEGPWAFIRKPLVVYRQSTKGDSLSLSITSQDPSLPDYNVRIISGVNASAQRRTPKITSRYMALGIRRAKLSRWALRLKQDRSSMKRRIAAFYKLVERYWAAVYIRSPLYPSMKTIPLQDRGAA